MKTIPITALDFLKKTRAGIYKISLDMNLGTEENLSEEEQKNILNSLSKLRESSPPGYIPYIHTFFNMWLNHRQEKKLSLPQPVSKQGFELYIPEITRITSPDKSWRNATLAGKLVATDLGYSGDYTSQLQFRMWHEPSASTFEYKENLQRFLRNPLKRKRLIKTTSSTLESIKKNQFIK